MIRFLILASLLMVMSCTKDQGSDEMLEELLDDDSEVQQQEEDTFPDIDALKAADMPVEAASIEPVEEVEDVEEADPVEISGGGHLWVKASKAAVYRSPKIEGKPVIHLESGTKVPVLSKEYGWVQISGSKFIRIDQLTDRTLDSKNSKNLKFVTTPDLNIRSAPNRFSEIVGRLTMGEKVLVHEKSRDTWVKIGEGQFINGKYLVDTPDQVDWAH